MEINSFFSLILLMGAVLSFLLAMYLSLYPNSFFPNRILGVLVFSWSITVFAFIIQSPEFFEKYPHLYALWDVFTLLYFPLMYLYIRFYLYKDLRITYKTFLHILPALGYLIAFSPFLLLSKDVKLHMLANGFPGWFRPLQAVFNIIIILQGIFYSIYALRTLHHFQYFRKTRFSALQIETINWLRFFVILNIVLWIVGTTGAFLDIFGIAIFIDLFKVFYSGLTLLTILLSIFTIRLPALFSENEDLRMFISQPVNSVPKPITEPEKPSKDYQLLKDHLNSQKPYLKTDLKMQDLMQATGLSYKRISEIFNTEFNKSFFEVINEYRLEEALRLIREDFHKVHTLPHLAEKAGFNSKATFNRVFKKYTGKTPTEYINSVR